MDPVGTLAEIYPQLYLDPDKFGIDDYKKTVLRGERPDVRDLSHFASDPRDTLEHVKTPAGEVLVLTLYNRHDFEIFVRCMMAAKEGPKRPVPASMGASTLVAFNWPRINAHKEAFMRKQREAGVLFPDWAAEFKRFREVKENYTDTFIVLSHGPYSNVSADDVNKALKDELMRDCGRFGDEAARKAALFSEEEWIEKSDSIRKYHELTHFVCRRLYPDKIDAVWDELVADAAGIYAAFGRYHRRLEELFLGITDGRYTGGRLENYLKDGEDIKALAYRISEVLREFEKLSENAAEADIFDHMLMLEDKQEELWS